MGKTKVVITPKNLGSNGEGMSVEEDDKLDWMLYAKLLRKELKDIKAKKVPAKAPRKASNKPPTLAQLRSRSKFKQNVTSARELYNSKKDAHGKPTMTWKECMQAIYSDKGVKDEDEEEQED